jgi:hypothetical protein
MMGHRHAPGYGQINWTPWTLMVGLGMVVGFLWVVRPEGGMGEYLR